MKSLLKRLFTAVDCGGHFTRPPSSNVESILSTLDGMRQLKHGDHPTQLDVRLSKISNRMKVIGATAFSILCATVLYVILFGSAPPLVLKSAQIFGFAAMALAASWMVFDIAPAVVTLIYFRSDARRTFFLEIRHDSTHAEMLSAYDSATLEEAKRWLEIKIDRLKARKSAVIPMSPDGTMKIVLTVIGVIGAKDGITNQSPIVINALIYGGALIGGMAVGGMLLSYILSAYSYQRDLLVLTLARQSKGGCI